MANSRRDFLKNAAILSSIAGISSVLPTSIQRAAAINANPGTTFMDAEHIVFLMQENRSFDHFFGCLKGVRGFNDPRAKKLPDDDKVWIQKDKNGNAHAPFHIDIHKTKVTWQGGLPHGWKDQSAARNHGKYDSWIPVKSPMTMGHYDRSDVPFYYALADAFTICDHNFCSSLTGTTPNRAFFWTGNIRPDLSSASLAAVDNGYMESRDNAFVDWSTFPELLEDNAISWRIYQNELWTPNLKPDNVDYWLANYGDNAIEYFKRHQVKLSSYFRKNGDKTGKNHLSAAEVTAKYEALSQKQKNLIDKAFTTNMDPDGEYLKLTPFTFKDDAGKEQTMEIPKGDIFKQFRSDVQSGNLPTVSWLVAPQSFSDHTSSPLYGTWYVSQALDILTQNPEIWKKTIFILNYDENDGYFDHLPPFVVPKPGDANAGKTSLDIDVHSDYETKSDNPIGLGYRVPMIIASPWSKGGFVNSQICDHTSTLMFLEKFLEKKTGKPIKSPHISSWRRAICGNLSSAFRPYNGEKFPLPDFENKEKVLESIQNAKSKPKQVVPTALSATDIAKINQYPAFAPQSSEWMPRQEKGSRPASGLHYQLIADCLLDPSRETVSLRFEAGNLGKQGFGAPFNMYTPSRYREEKGKTWAYAVSAGNHIEEQLQVADFSDSIYDVCIHGPNGFYRGYRGHQKDPLIHIKCGYEQKGLMIRKLTGNLLLDIFNPGSGPIEILLKDNAYKTATRNFSIAAGAHKKITVNLSKNDGWYDFSLSLKEHADFLYQYAGHADTGEVSITDPYMGGEII